MFETTAGKQSTMNNLTNMNACCFTGHRTLPLGKVNEIKRKLLIEVIWLASHGIDTFYVGGAMGFDLLAGRAVLEARNQGRRVKLIVVVPFVGQEKNFSPYDKIEYNKQLSEADEVIKLSNYYSKGCFLTRDRYLVDHSSICVCYKTSETGGTAYTVSYAMSKKLRVINLADDVPDDNDLGRDFI